MWLLPGDETEGVYCDFVRTSVSDISLFPRIIISENVLLACLQQRPTSNNLHCNVFENYF